MLLGTMKLKEKKKKLQHGYRIINLNFPQFLKTEVIHQTREEGQRES